MLTIATNENAKLNEKYNESVKESDGYVTKIASMDEKIDVLVKENDDKVKELKEVGVCLGRCCVLVVLTDSGVAS